ncbi:helix-turn-helix domain-containing protein [Bacillus sp. OTU530]|uniref:helix-turn-helix domain-containing protein n=1 Tax=Bacillus sp. OTU530 TaxID=3043862 RepID=UPI00313C33BC
MSEEKKMSNLGLILKELLKERSLSLRKFSEIAGVDTATISRIINGKRKATPEHLQRFADCLGIPMSELFVAAGYPIEQKQPDIHTSIDSIQDLLDSSNFHTKKFSIESVEQELAKYEQFSQTEEGKEIILKGFEEKLQKVGSIGPFINQLMAMYETFFLKKSTKRALVLIGSALIYFILPVDVIPDYIFPIGYIDDASAVQIVTSLLSIEG